MVFLFAHLSKCLNAIVSLTSFRRPSQKILKKYLILYKSASNMVKSMVGINMFFFPSNVIVECEKDRYKFFLVPLY